jgi:phosphate acetyltransferase
MNFVTKMKTKAKSAPKRLVLPESTEPRILKAARTLMDEKLTACIFLVGNAEEIQEAAKKEGVNIEDIQIITPDANSNLDKYAETYYEMRKHKGMTQEQAKLDLTDPLRWGAMMVHLGDADAMVAGAEKPTGDVVRACLTIIGITQGLKTASSCFVMTDMEAEYGKDGAMIFSDCAMVPNPTAEQLADITESAAQSCREFLETEPVAAMLSFSTRSSAKHDDVTKVQTTVEILKNRNVNFLFDGELQVDAALIPSVMEKKAPDSPIMGKVNVMIFPNLDAGNIGYKLVQRLGKAEAYGPFLQGFAKPVSDLSRGASIDDIVTTCAVTLSRAK